VAEGIVRRFEEGLLERLEAVPALRTVRSYAGELAEAIEEIQSEALPAAFTLYAAAAIDRPDADTRRRRVQWVVLLAARNLRTEAEARNDALDLVEAITGALDGVRLPDATASPAEVTDHLLVGAFGGGLLVYQVNLEAVHEEDRSGD